MLNLDYKSKSFEKLGLVLGSSRSTLTVETAFMEFARYRPMRLSASLISTIHRLPSSVHGSRVDWLELQVRFDHFGRSYWTLIFRWMFHQIDSGMDMRDNDFSEGDDTCMLWYVYGTSSHLAAIRKLMSGARELP